MLSAGTASSTSMWLGSGAAASVRRPPETPVEQGSQLGFAPSRAAALSLLTVSAARDQMRM
jgi:hypothetical protein